MALISQNESDYQVTRKKIIKKVINNCISNKLGQTIYIGTVKEKEEQSLTYTIKLLAVPYTIRKFKCNSDLTAQI